MSTSSDHQSAVFAYFGDAANHPGSEIKRIDTHSSVVFLIGARAFKIKRAVKFPFLDYTTLDKRHAACLGELDVNKLFAPQLYHRVVPITRNVNGGIALNGSGDIVEWAIEMQRFDEGQTLDHVAERNGIDDELAEKLARMIAAIHARSQSVDVDTWLNAVERFLDQNDLAFRQAPELFPVGPVEVLNRHSREALARLRPLLEARGSHGFVRRGHGDLHLGNIALLDGQPVPFDAIEFDPMIAAGDVLYEVAFLLMDLVERRQDRAANIILNRYLLETRKMDGLDGLTALPFFMSLRAAIRAMVLAAQIQRAGPKARASLSDTAKVYFNLAVRLLAPSSPVLVAIGGLSGTGKSTLARALAPYLAPAPGAVIVRSDVERKSLFGVEEMVRLAPHAYRPEITAKVYAQLTGRTEQIIAAGHSAIADAVFADSDERTAMARIASKNNVRFCGFFLVADIKTRLDRINTRGPNASDADAEIARQQENHAPDSVDWTIVEVSGSLDETLGKVRAAIGEAL
jgi:aminoglycoside phosphotransferase family enzyme/predicted kinase